MHSAAPPTARGEPILVTGLPPLGYAALVAASILLFLFWGGPLWTSEAGTSQAARFFLSYLAVVPAAALLLWWRHGFSWWRLGTAVGTVWAIKLVVTSALYYVLAPGGIVDQAAVAPAPVVPHRASAVPVPSPRYTPASGDFARGAVDIGLGGSDAFIAFLDAPRAGAALAAGGDIAIEMTESGFSSRHHLATTADTLRVHNAGSVLHAVKLSGASAMNRPTPPGATIALDGLEPGVYTLGCATHAAEHALLVVVDHPYAAVGDAAGTRLRDVPAGSARLVVLHHDGTRLHRHTRAIDVRPDAGVVIALP